MNQKLLLGVGVCCLGLGVANAADPLEAWAKAKVSVVSDGPQHTMHAYFNTSPESPDGRWVLFYASTTADGHEGEVRIRERATGKEIVLARGLAVEDAHRVACQQWVSNGRRVAFHHVLPGGEWVVSCVDLDSGKQRLLAKGRQLGFGQPAHDLVPLYGPHWNPGSHRDLELLNVATGEVRPTALTAAALVKAYPDWIAKQFGDRPVSIFFPLLSPDLNRVMFKVATPAGGDFRSTNASRRYGLVCYDLKEARFLSLTEKWGHPAWHPNSRDILEVHGQVIDSGTGQVTRIADFPRLPGTHPSFSPDGKLYTSDSQAEGELFQGPKGSWAVVVGDIRTGKYVTVHRFDHSQGARSWRVSHPHPIFSPDGKRLYFNISDGPWTRLMVAERTE
jgi:hypothetical protein